MQQKVGNERVPGLLPVCGIAGLIEHQGPVAQAGNDALVILQDDKVQVEVGRSNGWVQPVRAYKVPAHLVCHVKNNIKLPDCLIAASRLHCGGRD